MAASTGPARRPLLGILTLTVSLLAAVSLLSSPPWEGAQPAPGLSRDACGLAGKMVASLLLGEAGLPLSIWGGVASLVIGWRWVARRPRRPWRFLLWGAPTAFAAAVFGALVAPGEVWGTLAGWVSGRLSGPDLLGSIGSALAAGGVLLVLLVIGVTRWVPARARAAMGRWMARSAARVSSGLSFLFEGTGRGIGRLRPVRRPDGVPDSDPERGRERRGAGEGDEWTPSVSGSPAGVTRAARGLRAAAANGEPPRGGPLLVAEPTIPPPPSAPRASGVRRPAAALAQAPDGDTAYVVPPFALLERGEPVAPVNREELLETSRVLVRTLKDFGILGQVGQIHPGPVVTQYEYEPAAGIKVVQIVSRAEDLALALRASRIRLIAPIPGKGAVGVEVPNRAAALIALRPILEECEPASLPGDLPLVLGRDSRGRLATARLEQMPHLLVAGTTGSGKSVFLNCVLLSLLLRRTPEELRLLLIDPKMLELTPYDGIPHLVCPVVTEGKVAARMLAWAVSEMEARYRRLAAVGVRNLDGYRSRSAAEGLEPMPYIVVIVDELADLMLTMANEIEMPIARLAQMARAVGIHLVVATQRPSVDVITGVIKANFPARIAFQVASKVDSRTILDANGAESLLGRGDMLFLPPGKAEAVRVHGAFVGERDTEAIADFWRQQPAAPPLFREESLLHGDSGGMLEDDLFEDALRLVVMQKQASVSFLQRRLKIGYSRAGRLMDLLEMAGAVGAQDGSKTREVIADAAFLEQWRKNRNQETSSAADPAL